MADDATDNLIQGVPVDQGDEQKATLLGKTDDVIGVLANYFQFLGIPGVSAFIALMLRALDKPTPPGDITILEHLQTQVTDLVIESGAQESEIKMLLLAPKVGDVYTELEILRREGANGPHVNRQSFFENSLALVRLLVSDIYWYRPLLLGALFTPSYVGGTVGYAYWSWSRPDLEEGHHPYRLIPPQNTTLIEGYATVFDPQLALPAYLMAIESFLAINALQEPTGFSQFLGTWREDIKGFADYLQDIYDGSISHRVDTLVGGLVKTNVPSINEVYDYVQVNAIPDTSPGFEWNGVYGVVDVYGVYTSPVGVPSHAVSHFMDIFPTENIVQLAHMMRNDYTYIESIYPWVRDRVTLRLLARWKALYILRGYDKAWSVLQKLRVLTSEQDRELNDANKNWSARELITILHLPTVHVPNVPQDYPQQYSLSDLIERLDQIAKGTWNKTPDPWSVVLEKRPEYPLIYDPSIRPVGFRDRLAAAAL